MAKTKRKALGFLVMEHCTETGLGQVLTLAHDTRYPPEGLLEWGGPAFVFATRSDANKALDRTFHYAAAFNRMGHHPDRTLCKIHPLVTAL